MPELDSIANTFLLSSITVCRMEYVTRPLSPSSPSVAVSSLKSELTAVEKKESQQLNSGYSYMTVIY